MHNISNDIRRATRDLDLDFIKYSLDDKSIIEFINLLNYYDKEINIQVIGQIKPLHYQDYNGKRVLVKLTDREGNILESKLDIGVHKLFDLEQEEYCFNFDIINQSANLFTHKESSFYTIKQN